MILPCVEKSSGVTAPFERMPTLKMPRSSIFTFLPSISSSLIQFTMSFSIPWMRRWRRGVVGGHVLGQGGDVYRLLAYGTGVPLVEGCHVLLVLVLILLVADHNVLFFNVDTKDTARGMGALVALGDLG